MKEQKKEKTNIPELLVTFGNMFTKVTPDLIKKTGLYGDEVLEEYKKAKPEMVKFLRSKELMNIDLAIENNKNSMLNKCIDIVYKKHKNEINPLEVEEITNLLKILDNRYDFKDPRVFVIIKQLIDITIATLKIRLDGVGLNGILTTFYSDSSEPYYYNNPALKLKLEHNMAVVRLMSELNKIIEGAKLKIDGNIQFEIIPIDKIYTKPKLMQ